MCANSNEENADLKSVDALPQDDVAQQQVACATDDRTKMPEGVIPPKKRKTRRGKTKRRNYPYNIKNYRKSNKVIKPEAPHNSNQFLLEDHGNIEELDQKLKCSNDQASSSTITRTRDSSFSVDTVDSEGDGDFYSSPDEEFLIQDFDDQYETLHTERLYAMTKNELIQEYLCLESKVEELTKQLFEKTTTANGVCDGKTDLQTEVERLRLENERLRCENSDLKSKISVSCSSDSADSETDSSDSCSSSSSSMSRSPSPIDYTQTNGHSPTIEQSV